MPVSVEICFYPHISFSFSGFCLQCYTDIDGKIVATCNELEGFKTCFTKYNDSKTKIIFLSSNRVYFQIEFITVGVLLARSLSLVTWEGKKNQRQCKLGSNASCLGSYCPYKRSCLEESWSRHKKIKDLYYTTVGQKEIQYASLHAAYVCLSLTPNNLLPFCLYGSIPRRSVNGKQ